MLEELVKIKGVGRTVTVALFLLSGTATGDSPKVPEARIARSQAIHFTRENLSRPSGVEHVYRRIVLAARSVCGYEEGVNIRQSPEYEQCYAHAVDEAVTSVGSSALTALHRDRTRYRSDRY
ncbi:MAG: UrcA family protein [Steroidobacteraceae bacterium]